MSNDPLSALHCLVSSVWNWATTDATAFFTLWVAVFTGAVAFSTIGLWIVTGRGVRRQAEDTRILQRAYLAARLGGIHPFVGGPEGQHNIVGHVDFENAGNLPARGVTWFIDLRLSTSSEEKHFPIDDSAFFGNNVIPPRSVMRQGTRSEQWSQPEPPQYAYVWGEIRYDDGFGVGRFTKFCHRYNRVNFRKGDRGHGVPAEDGRYHEFGNDAD